MSMLIKGMEMPGSCIKCPIGFFVDEYTVLHCPLTEEEITESIFVHKRSENCPLVPVHAHGRLIDADALKAEGWELQMLRHDEYGCSITCRSLDSDDIPIIIPAEGGE